MEIDREQGLRYSRYSDLLTSLARLRALRPLCLHIAQALEGGPLYSGTLRAILFRRYGVRVGAYSYGECLRRGAFPPGVSVGRYVSIASGVRVLRRNHTMDRLSTHPFFFNHHLGWVAEDPEAPRPLEIGHDAWIGAGAMILPGCGRIGIGAVVGAGAVVTADVPDFAIVAGNPARLLRNRFPPELCARILASRWWEHTVEECARSLPFMEMPLVESADRHPLLDASPPS